MYDDFNQKHDRVISTNVITIILTYNTVQLCGITKLHLNAQSIDFLYRECIGVSNERINEVSTKLSQLNRESRR